MLEMVDYQDCSYYKVSKPKEQGVEKFWMYQFHFTIHFFPP